MDGGYRRPPAGSRRAGLWTSAPLAPWARVLVVVAAAVVGTLDVADVLADGEGALDAVVVVAVYLALALVAYRVTVGATAVMLVMLVSATTELWLPTGVLGLALSGVVVGKATPRFAAGYVTAALLWLVLVLLAHENARGVAIVPVTVLVASVSVGAAYAALSQRSAAAADRISGFEEERARSLAEERDRIARELHDIVAHHVTMASMHADVVSMSEDAAQRDRSLRVIADSTRQALTELRWMLRVLQTPEELAGLGEKSLRLESIVTAVREHLHALGLRTEVDYDPAVLEDLPLELDVALGRILQEAATNVVKHADPNRPVVLRAARDAGRLRLELRNTVGEASSLASSGLGLGNMSARAQEHGGTVTGSREGDTWVLCCVVPVA